MSIKIFNGYRIEKMSVEELVEFTKRIRLEMLENRKELALKSIGCIIASDIDQLTLFGLSKFKEELDDESETLLNPMNRAYRLIQKRYEDSLKTNKSDPLVDFDTNLIIVPHEDYYLALLYTEQDSFADIFLNQPEVSYYGYWNNSDKDDDVSEADWEKRKLDWESVFSSYQSPNEVGMNIALIKGMIGRFDINTDEVLQELTSFEDRLQSIVYEQILLERIDRDKPMTSTSNTLKWLDTKEGLDYIQVLKGKFSHKMIKNITKEMITTSYENLC